MAQVTSARRRARAQELAVALALVPLALAKGVADQVVERAEGGRAEDALERLVGVGGPLQPSAPARSARDRGDACRGRQGAGIGEAADVAEAGREGADVTFAEVEPVFAKHCAVCHASEPSMDGFDAPPAGVVLETPEQIWRHADAIHAQVVLSDAMPPGNLTGITDAERRLIAAWVAAGAPTE